MDKIAARMMALFSGLENVHGTHGTPDKEGLKWGIKRTARTLREPVTEELWVAHLCGERPLGVVPIRADGTCVWGSIDVDQYDTDLMELVRKVERQGYPLVCCRSKSGGLHLFLFLAEPQPAAQVQSQLREMAAKLGVAGSEIFPKQTQLNAERGDAGSWMVVPYYGDTFGGRLREQVGLRPGGGEMVVEDFILVAEAMRKRVWNPDVVAAPLATEASRPFADGPRCLENIMEAGGGKFQEGGRNNSMLMVGIYLKKKHPDDWERRLEEMNHELFDPPLVSDEVASAIRSLKQKDYQYTCKTEPMCQHCDATLCRSRRYGVGAGGGYPVIEGLTRVDYDPPEFHVTTPFGRVTVKMKELYRFDFFNSLCGEQTGRVFTLPPKKQADWLAVIDAAMQEAVVVEPPLDLAPGMEFLEHLAEFLRNRGRAQKRTDMLIGQPWKDLEDDDDGRRSMVDGRPVYWFQMKELVLFLKREGCPMPRNKVADLIRHFGGGAKVLKVGRGHPLRVWWIEAGDDSVVERVARREAPGGGLPTAAQVI